MMYAYDIITETYVCEHSGGKDVLAKVKDIEERGGTLKLGLVTSTNISWRVPPRPERLGVDIELLMADCEEIQRTPCRRWCGTA